MKNVKAQSQVIAVFASVLIAGDLTCGQIEPSTSSIMFPYAMYGAVVILADIIKELREYKRKE